MICEKCNFDLKEIEVSHDIPKYLGGTDKDGRHNLCKRCHQQYESEILKVVLMNFFLNLTESEKNKLRNYAKIVKNYFFKEDKDDTTKTTT